MKVPFIDLKKQYDKHKAEIDKAVQNVIDNSSFILGKAVADFEKDFASAHNVRHCICTGSGTDANHLALWASGIKSGDEVIIPVNTFIATAWGATLCGAVPVFVDCDERSYNIDPSKIEEKINRNTRAIVAVHLYGQSADLDPLKDLADKHNLILLEDAAQSHLAEYKGRRTGNTGLAASFSFYPGKNLGAFGEGGALVTNDDDFAKKVRMLRDHGSQEKYFHETYGHNYRMDGIQGAVLGVKLKYLEEWTSKRRDAVMKYNEYLKEIPELILPAEMQYARHVYHLYVVQTPRRAELQNFLNENDISTGLHYPVPLHLQKCFAHLGYKKGDFPVAEKLADNCLSLPLFPDIEDAQIRFVCDRISEFFEKK